MINFIGWIYNSNNVVVPVFRLQNNSTSRVRIGGIARNYICIYEPRNIEFGIYDTVEEAFRANNFIIAFDTPSFWRYNAPLTYTFRNNYLGVHVERDYREFSHSPCMSQDMINMLGYERFPRLFFSTAQEAENHVRETYQF